MSATDDGAGAAVAPSVIAALRTDVFDQLAAARGARTQIDKARLIGVDRATLARMRRREFAPRLAVAMRMAERLGTTVDDLFEQVAA